MSLIFMLLKFVFAIVAGLFIGGIGIAACGTAIGIPALGVAAIIFLLLL